MDRPDLKSGDQIVIAANGIPFHSMLDISLMSTFQILPAHTYQRPPMFITTMGSSHPPPPQAFHQTDGGQFKGHTSANCIEANFHDC